MDMSTMRQKLDTFQYQGLDDLEADFTLMVNNCLSYNERDTIFYRAGIKMRDAGGLILRYHYDTSITVLLD
jgi:bromodomain and PHD finger-containing protein 1